MLHQTPPTIISSEPKTIGAYFASMMRYSRLIWVFAYQELRSMYAQTYLGIIWAVIRPLFTLIIFTIIFKHFLKVKTETPYYLFAFSGMIAWNFFSQIAVNGSTAIVQKQSLVRKMYFPKLILVFSKVIVVGVETAVSLVILFIMIACERMPLIPSMLSLPLFILLNIICGFAVAVWMNALNVRFRDLNQIVPAIISIAIWVTPVFYPTTVVPQEYSFLIFANPLAGVIKGYRFALFGEPFPEWQYWISILVTILITLAGILYFTRVENRIADDI